MFSHRRFPAESHNTTAPPALYWALQELFADWTPDLSVLRRGLPGLKTHYKALSSRFDWDIPVPVDTVYALVFDFSRRNKPGDSRKVFELVNFAVTQEPSGPTDLAEMIAALRLQGHPDAADLVQRALCNSKPRHRSCVSE